MPHNSVTCDDSTPHYLLGTRTYDPPVRSTPLDANLLHRHIRVQAHSWSLVAKMPQAQPELKKVSAPRRRGIYLLLSDGSQYLEKRVLVQLNGSRKVMGILRGYDVGDKV